ncbi:MAG: hypothetical protein RR640_01145, partial [Oscillospiraceae bacterium]
FNNTAIKWISMLLGLALIIFSILSFFIHMLRYFNFKSALNSFKKLKDKKYIKTIKEYKINKLKLMDVIIIIALVPIAFSLYCFLLFIIYLISYVQMRRDNLKRKTSTLISGLISFGFFITFLIQPLHYVDILTILIGCLLIGYGFIGIFDFFTEIDPKFYHKHFFAKIKIALPVFFTAFIPHRILVAINKAIATDKTATAETLNLDVHKTEEKAELEIFVHVSDNGVGTIGHADLCFEGEVLSYGAYDEKTSKLFNAIGDGCYFKTKNRDKYLDFCIKNDEKTMFVFGIKLTDEQKEILKKEIAKLEKDIYIWLPPCQVDIEKGNPLKEEYSDYASKLVMGAGVTFYKFKRGTYKSYFVLNTNCVKLPERLLYKSGAGVLAYSGIISPGTFFNYLNGEFLKSNTCVISRTVYNDTLNKVKIKKKKKHFKK